MDNTILRKAIVEEVDNNTEAVKVKIKNNTDDASDEDIVESSIKGLMEDTNWALPLFPMIAHIVPKVGEAVYIITPEIGNNNAEGMKYYLGPIISLPTHLHKEPSNIATSINMSSNISMDIMPSEIKGIGGCFPDADDIAIMGRKNSELILKDDTALLRTDVRHYSTTPDANNCHISYNAVNSAYLQLKSAEGQEKEVGSTATIVADNINLIGNSGDGVIPTNTNSIAPINDKKLNEIIDKAHQLPFGDILADFLNEIVNVLLTHVHAYVGVPMDMEGNAMHLQKRAEGIKDEMLSKNVRIN